MRKPLLIVTTFVAGGMVGWMHGSPDIAASPSHGMISCPTEDGGRKTLQLRFSPIKIDAHGDVVLGPKDLWIEIGGKAYVATPP